MIKEQYVGNKEKLRRANQKIVCLKKELKHKDKIIDLMAEWISERCFYIDEYSNSCEVIQDSCYKEKNCKECVKQYFENKVNSSEQN